jgi:hypothetical protein
MNIVGRLPAPSPPTNGAAAVKSRSTGSGARSLCRPPRRRISASSAVSSTVLVTNRPPMTAPWTTHRWPMVAPGHLDVGVLAAVNDGVVLQVRSRADDNATEVGAEHRAVPDGRAGLDDDVAHDRRRRGAPRLGVHLRCAALRRTTVACPQPVGGLSRRHGGAGRRPVPGRSRECRLEKARWPSVDR